MSPRQLLLIAPLLYRELLGTVRAVQLAEPVHRHSRRSFKAYPLLSTVILGYSTCHKLNQTGSGLVVE